MYSRIALAELLNFQRVQRTKEMDADALDGVHRAYTCRDIVSF